MIDFRATSDGFMIVQDAKVLLTHCAAKPLFELFDGPCEISMRHGLFTSIRKSITAMRAATTYTVDVDEDGAWSISFSGLLHMRIEDRGDYAHITFALDADCPLKKLILHVPLDPSEAILGCGEQLSHLDLRGKRLPIWVSEPGFGRGPNVVKVLADIHSGHGGSREHLYFPQTTFVTTGGCFVHIHATSFCWFNFTQPERAALEIHQIPSSFDIGKGQSLQQAVGMLSRVVGRQKTLPLWLYDGLVLGIQGGRKVVQKKLETALRASIPITGLWCQDWQGVRMTRYGKQLFWNWEADEQLYPDLTGYIEDLHKQNIRFMGYNNPFLCTDAPLYQEAAEQGFFVNDKSGRPAIYYPSAFNVSLLDLCNPDAVNWMKDIIRHNMIGIGLDGWMADFGEHLEMGQRLYQGADSFFEHNAYPLRWARLQAEAIEEAGAKDRIVFFCRAGFTGSTLYVPLFWAGDQLVNFQKDSGLPVVVPAGISSSASGVGYWHFDIGGFMSIAWIKRSPELLARSCETAAFTQVMRTHEGINPTANVQFDHNEAMLRHFERMVRIHSLLKPYHVQLSQDYQGMGLPPIQPVFIDQVLVNNQYFYGTDLLVAPVLIKGRNSRIVKLPEGQWIHLFSGRRYGRGIYNVPAPLGSPAVFYRSESANSALFGSITEHKEYEI